MNSEPQCECPIDCNGGIDHFNDCAWIVWKTGKTPEMPTVDNSIHDLNVTRLVVRNSLRMAAPVSINLVESITERGVIYPIEVLDLKNGYYQITHGVERFKAVIEIGLDSIPGRIISE